MYKQYLSEGKMPRLKKPRRKNSEIFREEREIIIGIHEKYRLGPTALEKKMEREYGIHIPHNRIYRILLEEGKIMENPKKRKRRKYVRFERKHSMSLWREIGKC